MSVQPTPEYLKQLENAAWYVDDRGAAEAIEEGYVGAETFRLMDPNLADVIERAEAALADFNSMFSARRREHGVGYS